MFGVVGIGIGTPGVPHGADPIVDASTNANTTTRRVILTMNLLQIYF
jgi:hypothetical protein